jgi:hypothetical protein
MRTAALLALAALAFTACTRAADDPEAEVRAFLRRAEQAVRDKDLGAIGSMVADDYRDEESRSKRDLVGFVGYQFMRQGSLHVATRLKKATFPAADSAKAQVLAALGRADFDWTKLPDLNADIQFVDLDLRRDDGEWQVTRADWRPATADDL